MADDVRIIRECLSAAASGPFFPDWEFDILFGLSRSELLDIARRWPNCDRSDATIALAVRNTLVHLLHYPHHHEDLWPHYISASRAELEEILNGLPRPRTR